MLGSGYGAQCRIGGKKVFGKRRSTVEEATADYRAMKIIQKETKIRRKLERVDAAAAERETHADHIAESHATYADSLAKDGLGRAILKHAFADHPTVGAVDGVEYAIDAHLYMKQDDMGFDAELDAELDDLVPTLAVELKVAQSQQYDKDDGRVSFNSIHYAGQKATIVLMMYVPEGYATASADALSVTKFWYEFAADFTPSHGQQKYALHDVANPERRGRPGHTLADTLAREVHRLHRLGALVPYGQRSRKFESKEHAVGQRVIDAIEDQVLRPQGARFAPSESGCEGDACDRVVVFADGTRKSAQVKKARRGRKAGFYVNMRVHNGSIRRGDGTKKMLTRPYSIADAVDLFLFGVLDHDGNLAEYWAPTQADLLGNGTEERLITDSEGVGVKAFNVHPLPEDKERLNDLVRNGQGRDDLAIRTRRWLRQLGPIETPERAAALKAKAISERRAVRLGAKVGRAYREVYKRGDSAHVDAGSYAIGHISRSSYSRSFTS
eukprot:6104967-Prymnesium_polylepis.2